MADIYAQRDKVISNSYTLHNARIEPISVFGTAEGKGVFAANIGM